MHGWAWVGAAAWAWAWQQGRARDGQQRCRAGAMGMAWQQGGHRMGSSAAPAVRHLRPLAATGRAWLEMLHAQQAQSGPSPGMGMSLQAGEVPLLSSMPCQSTAAHGFQVLNPHQGVEEVWGGGGQQVLDVLLQRVDVLPAGVLGPAKRQQQMGPGVNMGPHRQQHKGFFLKAAVR